MTGHSRQRVQQRDSLRCHKRHEALHSLGSVVPLRTGECRLENRLWTRYVTTVAVASGL
jgi:hypothetical protein